MLNCVRFVKFVFIQREHMKNVLKLSLAVLAAATLAACGGGDSSDATDAYVGTWKSACYSTALANYSGTFYTKRIRTIAKKNATELTASNILDNIYSDAACATVWGTWANNSPAAGNYVLGAKVPFLGANADSYVLTNSEGNTFAGFMALNGEKLYMADSATGAAPPTGWGKFSPYTKQ
jgi:hypothetical protein